MVLFAAPLLERASQYNGIWFEFRALSLCESCDKPWLVMTFSYWKANWNIKRWRIGEAGCYIYVNSGHWNLSKYAKWFFNCINDGLLELKKL